MCNIKKRLVQKIVPQCLSMVGVRKGTACQLRNNFATVLEGKYGTRITPTYHIAPRGAKKEEAFGGVILKSERPSGALFTNSGPPFFTVESKIEVLSPLGTSFH